MEEAGRRQREKKSTQLIFSIMNLIEWKDELEVDPLKFMKFVFSSLLWWVMGAAAPMAPPKKRERREKQTNEWKWRKGKFNGAAQQRKKWNEPTNLSWICEWPAGKKKWSELVGEWNGWARSHLKNDGPPKGSSGMKIDWKLIWMKRWWASGQSFHFVNERGSSIPQPTSINQLNQIKKV